MSHRVRPASATVEHTLPVPDAFGSLFPTGVPRGVTSTVSGDAARSFAFALTAAATRAGSWLAMIGVADTGWRALAETGVEMAHVVHVDVGGTGERTADCVAAALDGFDLVLVGSGTRFTGGVERRLAARARERGVVLIGVHEEPPGTRRGRVTGPFDVVADLRATTRGGHWHGLGTGAGHLTGRQVDVVVEGRRLPGRRRRDRLWLPGSDGAVAEVGGAPTNGASLPRTPRVGTALEPVPSTGEFPADPRDRPIGRSA